MHSCCDRAGVRAVLFCPGCPLTSFSPNARCLPPYRRYSGTSADLLKTALDLIISVRVFLGRFDMRTMQVGHQRARDYPGVDGLS